MIVLGGACLVWVFDDWLLGVCCIGCLFVKFMVSSILWCDLVCGLFVASVAVAFFI